MNRFFPSSFLGALVIIFVTMHFLVAFTDETFHVFSYDEVESEHHHSVTQESIISKSNKKASNRQGPPSHISGYMAPYLPALVNPDVSVIPSGYISYLSSVVLRI
jgi:hypothetical protein